MYPPKVQTITCRIEQRIRRGFYRDLLPVNDILQNEFHAARQTITRALRPLFASGLLECKSPRCGIRIRREKLNYGTIAIVSGEDMIREEKNLVKEITRDYFGVKVFLPSDSEKFRIEDAGQYCGILFLNSALSRETAERLQQMRLPFAACNRISFPPGVSYIDHDQEKHVRILLNDLLKLGYRRIGFFYSSPLQGYNELAMKIIRKVKRECGLPVEVYDRFAAARNKPADEELKKFLQICAKGKNLPEILIAKRNFAPIILQWQKQSGINLPENFRFLFHRGRNERISTFPWVFTFYFSSPNWRLWLCGYELLRERMLFPDSRPVTRLQTNHLVLDRPIPSALN